MANVTSPAPARNAPRADIRAAPVAAMSPETTTACPRLYLCPSTCGTGKALCQTSGVFSKVCGAISPSTWASMPMSATRTRPQCSLPGSNRCAGFCRKKVTVSVARTAAPITAPVVPLMPLGRSTLSTGAPLALIASIISSGSPFTGRLRPAPNNASMIRAGFPIACGLNGSTGCFHPRAARRRIALQGVALAQQDDRDLAAARSQFGCGHEPVAAIVAAAGNDQDRPLLRKLHRRLRHRLARAEHQREAGRAGGNGQPVGVLHFGRGQNFHAKFLT